MYIKISFKWKCCTGESLKMKKTGYVCKRNKKITIRQVKAADGSNIRLVSFLFYFGFCISVCMFHDTLGIHFLAKACFFISYFGKIGGIYLFSLSTSRNKRATNRMLALKFCTELQERKKTLTPAHYITERL